MRKDLGDIFHSTKLPLQRARLERIQQEFAARFNNGVRPTLLVRSPGRVNLIGEHIDYSGYSVLPMALDCDVIIAISPTNTAATELAQTPVVLTVVNSNEGKYPNRTFRHVGKDRNFIEFDSTQHDWANYFAGAYRAVFEKFGESIPNPTSFNALVDGSVPAGGGVSSSAAFCCAASLAVAAVNKIDISREDLVEVSINAEHNVGVKCGGMDQSISVMGVRNSALLIHFVPRLSVEPIPIPAPDLWAKLGPEFDPPVFVVANTLVVSDKHKTAPTNYNLRVVETKLAAAILSRKLTSSTSFKTPSTGLLLTLRDVADAFNNTKSSSAQQQLQLKDQISLLAEMMKQVHLHLKHEPYSWEDVALELGVDVETIGREFVQGQSLHIVATHFQLHKRAMHVYGEAKRVFEFQNVCLGLSPYNGNLLESLGGLMNQSQDSCRDLFGCSCPELDDLVKLCRLLGAFGSRLTGAGWGGCAVSLVSKSMVDTFVENLKKQYFTPVRLQAAGKSMEEIEDVLFYCAPGAGSAIILNTI